MVRITINEQLKRQLLATDGVAQLCDSSGMPIARVALIPNGYEQCDWPATQPSGDEDGSVGISTQELLIRLLKKRRSQRS